tara:strand:+ start:730 stop:1185 length:456 start_codon:yes stop_codon:yes gene_type:complete
MTTIDTNNSSVVLSKVTTAVSDQNLDAEGSYSLLVSVDSVNLHVSDGAIASSSITDLSVLNKYSVSSIEFVTAFGFDEVSSLILQAGDGSGNWTDLETVIADTEPNVAGTKAAFVDLRNVFVPQLRYVFNPENNTIEHQTNGIVKFKIGVS